MQTMLISGSHGAIRADMATGVIVDRGEPCSCEDCGGTAYGNIARVDPVTLAHEAEGARYFETDVLAVGYWTAAGDYAEPLTVRTVVDHYGSCVAAMDFDDWVPLRLLPAPRS
ncbi:hypothetical protein [Sphingomonas panaciterrae]|uniref:hypothetical protein n=1 Tax=Sphingomonas panaciterrae TaxID=1462999 RepID=UPI002FEF9059